MTADGSISAEELQEAQKDAISVVYDPDDVCNYLLLEDNVVVNIIRVENSPAGEAVVATLDGSWVKDPGEIDPKKTAGIGWVWDPTNSEARPVQPFPSWSFFNTDIWDWDPPVPFPNDSSKQWIWNEDGLIWDEIVIGS